MNKLTKDQQKLVNEAIPIAKKLVWKLWQPNSSIGPGLITYEDLYQEALYGLCLAATRFDPDRGVKWSTYAWSCVYGRICNYFRDRSSTLVVPRKIKEAAKAIQAGKPVLMSEYDRQITESFLANKGLTNSLADYQRVPEPPPKIDPNLLKPLADLDELDFKILEDYVYNRPLSKAKTKRGEELLKKIKSQYDLQDLGKISLPTI